MNESGHEILSDRLRHFAACSPDTPALLSPDESAVSYGELWSLLGAFQQQMAAAGVEAGQRVVVTHDDTQEFALLIAMTMCSFVAIPVSPNVTAEEFSSILERTDSDAIVVGEEFDPELKSSAERKQVRVVGWPGHKDLMPEDLVASEQLMKSGLEKMPFSRPDHIALVIQTSGTTAEPKLTEISHEVLANRVLTNSLVMELTEEERYLNFMPLYHVGGLSAGLATALSCGCAFVTLSSQDVKDFERVARNLRPTVVSAGHAVCRALAKQFEDRPAGQAPLVPGLRLIRSGAGHLEETFVSRILEVFGVEVRQVYGSSETGFMGFTVVKPGGAMPTGLRICDGVEIKIEDSGGARLEDGEVGEIVVSGNRVAGGGVHRTGDAGFVNKEACLQITGRMDDLINRGGQKVAPEEIDAILQEIDGVAEAATFPVSHPTLGQEVCAVVVPERGATLSENRIEEILAQYLAPYKRPKYLTISEAIPLSANGKLQRRILAEHFGIRVPLERQPGPSLLSGVESSSETESRLAQIWCDSLNLKSVSPDVPFFMLGGDFLKSIELALAIEEKFNIQLPPLFVYETQTIQGLAGAIDDGSYVSPITTMSQGSDKFPLFFVHDIDGDMKNFRPLASKLTTGQSIYGISATSRGGLSDSGGLQGLAARYGDMIRSENPSGPIYLLGYSFGGLVAYEIARFLDGHGVKVGLVTMIDSNLSKPDKRQSWARRHWVALKETPILRWPAYVLLRIRSNLKHFVSVSSASIEQQVLPQVRLFRKYTRGYQPEKYGGDVLLLRASNSDLVGIEEWPQYIDGSLVVETVDGDHNSVMYAPMVDGLAEIISSYINDDLNRQSA